MPRDADSWMRDVLLVLGLVAGIYLRIHGVGDVPLFGDEYHTCTSIQESYGTILSTFDDTGSHVVTPLLQRLCMDLFGDGVASFRLPAVIPAILTLLLLFPLARSMVGATPATLATLALVVNPMHVYYSRFGRAYALIVLLSLCLGAAVIRAVRSGERRWWAAVAACAALIAYTHLSSAGFVAGMALAALFLAWRRERSPGALIRPAAAFAVAAILLFLLFLPLIGQLRAFFDAMPEARSRPLGWFGIPTLLAGGRLAALVWLVAFPIGVVALARSRQDLALVSAAALIGPLVALAVTLPHGMDYAYARYLLSALPFVLIVIAWLVCAGLRRLVPSEKVADRLALTVVPALLLAGYLTGPLSPSRPEDRSFSNTYLAMWPLPAFDAPHPNPPRVYEMIAQDVDARRIIEAQPLQSRAVLLYRGYTFVHGKDVVVGWPEKLPRALRNGPYSDYLDGGTPGADYLLLHKDLRREVNEYWRFVYFEAWPDHERWGDESFMERHKATFIRGQDIADPAKSSLLAVLVRRKYGEPTFEDERVWAWKLRP